MTGARSGTERTAGSHDQRSGGSLPSLKPGEILGAGALADRARLSALAEGGRAVGITIACPAIA